MEEEKYMRRCIQLAQNGFCNAAPNPMVGAVIVCDRKIIGEGYHVRCGEAHAEVNAIRSVKDLETDPDDFEEDDIEKLRKAIAKELGLKLPALQAPAPSSSQTQSAFSPDFQVSPAEPSHKPEQPLSPLPHRYWQPLQTP